jgi:glycosyltransferase involved in cell wall biosynthesis
MNSTYLSIIIPCFNEKKTILKVINQIKRLKKIKKQIILVDDGSNDGTRELINKKLKNKVDKILFHRKNKGKGAAIISSIKFIRGNLVLIQDADLEYNPNDYYKLIKPFSNNNIKAVYGSRVLGRKKINNLFSIKSFPKNFRIFGNFVLTKISNFVNNQSLTDVHTCYKVFRKDVFFKLKIKEKNFSFCPEVTTKLAKLSFPIIEVPISYNGREIKDGKKIRFRDALSALFTILKYKYFN